MNQSLNKSRLLASTLGLALLAGPAFLGQALVGQAWAQQADAPLRRNTPMPAPGQGMTGQGTTGQGMSGAPGAAHGAGMHRHHHAGAHEGGPRAERRAMRAANREDAGELVQAASAALRAGRTAQATDLLEQSETRLLTRAAPASRADQPASGPVLDRLAAARGAIRDRDRAAALREMDQALAGLRMAGGPMGGPMGSDTATGADAVGIMPAEGSGWGAGRMRDGGPAGTSMSRADHIIRVQSSGSGGLSGSTPGSPGAGNPGSTPSTGMGTTTQPSQGSASPGSASPGGRSGMGSPGVGAPPPGAGAPMQGGNAGVGTGTGTIRPGSTPSGGGTGSNPSR
ncbi:MAG: hypothetical protein JWP04_4068 [Belnapia sp.]|nr:hypothetical protein [Belnapia sp.]